MKKLQLLFVAITLLFSVNAKADDTINSSLDLNNPDVRKCLLEATQSEGWTLESLYLDSEKKVVMIFGKENETRVYKSK
ncbi:hypothetical protein GCM10023311_13660 [Flaviramulus aquimarinus]|uniref:Uncharacterized protein n=1 Tax=Flaviramulus aquimarinus TaxID=1170456 RepID=A0ABP9F093_9FLAO